MLCSAILEELGEIPSRPASHGFSDRRSWRSIQHAVYALCASQQVALPHKTDELPEFLAKVHSVDGALARRIERVKGLASPTSATARAVLREVASHFSRHGALSPYMTTLLHSINGPLANIAHSKIGSTRY
jgi:hypothetical protein